MKTKLLIAFIMIIPYYSIGQGIDYGITAGINICKWRGNNDLYALSLTKGINKIDGFSNFYLESQTSVGGSLGLYLDAPIINSLSIQPEINYILKGTMYSGEGKYNSILCSTNFNYQLNYIDLGALLKYSPTKWDARPYIAAGLDFGYLISSEMIVEVIVDGESDLESSEITGFQKFDTNLIFGIGFSSELIGMDFRYSMGLIPVIPIENALYDFRNSVISLNIFVSLK